MSQVWLLKREVAAVVDEHAARRTRLLVLPLGQLSQQTTAICRPIDQAQRVSILNIRGLLQEAQLEIACVPGDK